MKKKRKYQNQLIFLNQNIHIKYYLNFLTFFFISGFRLKYYYNYMNYYKLFSLFSKVIGFSLRSHYLLKAMLIPNFLYFKLFQNYGSYTLTKFSSNKNIYMDTSKNFFFSKRKKIQKFNNFSYLLNMKNIIVIQKDDIQDNEHNLNLYKNICYRSDNINLLYNYFIYVEFLNMLFFLSIVINFEIYKFFLILTINKI